MKKLALIIFVVVTLISCKEEEVKNDDLNLNDSVFVKNTEARDDSLRLIDAYELQSKFEFKITANIESDAVIGDVNDDAADDPAIWLNEKHPDKSLILGTNKKGGLYVFDIHGKLISIKEFGMVNNVDLRDGFSYLGKEVVIGACSNFTNNSVSVFYIDKKTGELSDIITEIPTEVDFVYGLCMYKDLKNSKFYVIVNKRNGLFEQWLIFENDSKIDFQLERTFSVNSQSEGIAVNDRTDMIYLAVEQEGIFKISADPDKNEVPVMIPESNDSSVHIFYDIEGLEIFNYKGKDYLLASVQGNFSYALYETGITDKYLGSFIISDGKVDGVEETDGLDVVSTNLLKGFPEGIIVVQDGFNYDGDTLKNQNFKFIALSKISKLMKKEK